MRSIPLGEAAQFFMFLKYGSAGAPAESPAEMLQLWDSLPLEEQQKIAEEAPSLEEYMATEQAASVPQQAAESAFVENKLQAMKSQLEEAQQQAQSAQTQSDQLNQQLAMANQQVQAAQQQAVTAQQMAQQAQQTQLQSADQALQTQQLSAQMRTAYQQLRGQLMDLATQDPAQSVGNAMSGQPPEMGPTGAPGSPVAQLGPTSNPVDDAPQATAEQGQSALTNAEPAVQQADIKAASAAGVAGTLGGVAFGGLLAAAEAKAGPAHWQKKLEELQANEGGFTNAVRQAATKSMLAYSEAAQKHPVGAALVGAAAGGLQGGAVGEGLDYLMNRSAR